MLPSITIDGRLVADTELKFTPGGKAVANMRVAASDSKKDDAGEWQTTEQIFINVTLWEAEAETAAEHFVKGDRVLVSGRIYQREYEKSDGSKGYSLEVKFPTVAKIPATPRREQTQGQGAWAGSVKPANDPWATAPQGGASNGQPPF
jgi:single-strand DNA-binding protein